MNSDVPGGCSGFACGFGAFGDEVNCDTGSGSCWTAMMAEAETSGFHDAALQKATMEIQSILKSIPPDPKGRKLSFVNTEDGTILAWVNHGKPFPTGTVTLESGKDDVRKALKLKVPLAE
jgi:hypothetical protein